MPALMDARRELLRIEGLEEPRADRLTKVAIKRALALPCPTS